MIKTWNLFKVPLLSMFLIIIPVFGIFIFIMIVLGWALHRWEDIGIWLHENAYKQNEYSKESLDDLI